MRWPADPDARRRLAEALLDWVAALEEAEPLPPGLDPAASGEPPDLFAAVGEIEALRREVGLQGRTFARLDERIREAASLWEAAGEGAEARLAEARLAGRIEAVQRLLDAREAMARSLAVARGLARRLGGGLFGGRGRGAAWAALLQALEMNLAAVDEGLRDLDVRELQADGQPFDPVTMRAVEAADPREGAPGAVVATRRAGWTAAGRVLRHAEVRAVPERATSVRPPGNGEVAR